MSKVKAIAHILTFDIDGNSTAKPVRVYARLCTESKPQQLFEISLPDAFHQDDHNHRAIHITRTEIERVLADHPRAP